MKITKKQYILSAIAISSIVLIILLLSLLGSSNPFERIYPNEPKEKVIKDFGSPDYYSNKRDEYYNISFVGKKGTLLFYYNDNDELIKVVFGYGDSTADLTIDEENATNSYFADIYEFLVKEYGEPNGTGYKLYRWNFENGTSLYLYTNTPSGHSIGVNWSCDED